MRVLAVVDDTDPSFMRMGKVVRAVVENQMELTFLLLKESGDTPDLVKALKDVSRKEGLESRVEVIETANVLNPALPIAKRAREEGAVAVFVPEEMVEVIQSLTDQFRGEIPVEPISGAYPVREIMSSPPITVATDFTAHEVASTMKQRDISSVVVMD
ncbi:MAG: CBS domain-containing protein, partial [Euryarchaeota archaeon]|nr:CBS domain-containing protein [Euryarchaeota archaeon]